MGPAILHAAIFGALAGACGVLGRWPRRGWVPAVALALAGLVAAMALGVMPPSAWRTWVAAWPLEPLGLLLGWVALAWGLRRAGGVGGWGPPGVAAFLGGAAFGGPAVALGLAPGRPPREAARLVLLACAGGLCGPLGSAPLLALYQPGLLPRIAPLGIALGLLASVHRRRCCEAAAASPPGRAPRLLLAAALPVWVVAVLVGPAAGLGLALAVALVANILVGPLPKGRLEPARLAWLGATALLVLLLVPAGTLDFLAGGMADLRIEAGALLGLGAGLAGLLAGGLVPAVPLGLAGALSVASDPGAFDLAVRAPLLAGLAVGTLGWPLLLAGPGVLRAGLGRWALAIAAVLVWLVLCGG